MNDKGRKYLANATDDEITDACEAVLVLVDEILDVVNDDDSGDGDVIDAIDKAREAHGDDWYALVVNLVAFAYSLGSDALTTAINKAMGDENGVRKLLREAVEEVRKEST